MPYAWVNKAHGIRSRWVQRIAATCFTGDRQKLRKLKQAYFTDKMVKISALHKAGERQPGVPEWFAEADRLDLFTPFSEPVNWWHEPKRSGGYRKVCDLPRPLKATHYIIADAIRAQMVQPVAIYNLKGKGRDRLVSDLLAKLSQGFDTCRIYDVKDCFQSVNPNTIYQLPLPRRIIDHALAIQDLNLQRVATPTASYGDAPIDIPVDNTAECGPAGLMQGSPASNLILAYLLQTMPQPDPDGGHESSLETIWQSPRRMMICATGSNNRYSGLRTAYAWPTNSLPQSHQPRWFV